VPTKNSIYVTPRVKISWCSPSCVIVTSIPPKCVSKCNKLIQTPFLFFGLFKTYCVYPTREVISCFRLEKWRNLSWTIDMHTHTAGQYKTTIAITIIITSLYDINTSSTPHANMGYSCSRRAVHMISILGVRVPVCVGGWVALFASAISSTVDLATLCVSRRLRISQVYFTL
jgi:hypothetical protein